MAINLNEGAQKVTALLGDENSEQTGIETNPLWVKGNFNAVDSNNSTTTLLSSGATFTGIGTDISKLSNVTTQLFANQDSATDGMQFQFSVDNVNWDDSFDFTFTANEARRFQFPVTAQYFRVVFTNGGTNQTAFRVQTILHSAGVLTTIHRISDSISADNSAQLVKAVLTGLAPDGTFMNVLVTNAGNQKISIEEINSGLGSNSNTQLNVTPFDSNGREIIHSVTAFGEALVGQLHPQFQGSFEYTVDNTDLNTNTVVNGGTVTQASGMAVVGTSTTTASTALFQSKQHARYRAGLGGVIRFTARFTSPVAGTEQYIGIMDEAGSSEAFKNGYAVGYNGTTFQFLRWHNDSLTAIDQADWNVDTLGAGALNPSGLTLVQTNLNVFFIPYQFLGAGAIYFFVENQNTGLPMLVHIIKYSNLNTEPSVHNPNFFHTMWVANKATTSDIILRSSSYAYFIEGKTGLIELHQPQNSTDIREKTTITTETAIFTIRNKATYASKTNFIDILMLRVFASIEAASANNLANIRVVKNATIGGTPSYSDINTNNSVIEIDTAGTTVTGGTVLDAGLLAGKNDEVPLPLIDDRAILNPGETLTVAGESANSATIDAIGIWRELF